MAGKKHKIKSINKEITKVDVLEFVRDAAVAATAIIKLISLSYFTPTFRYLVVVGAITFATSRIANNGIKKHIIKSKSPAANLLSSGVLTAAQVITLMLGLGTMKTRLIIAIGIALLSKTFEDIVKRIKDSNSEKSNENGFDNGDTDEDFQNRPYSDQHAI